MKKFSIILLYYNQLNFLEDSLKAIFQQSYKNIELIIADDCSRDFDHKYVADLIKKYNKNNFEVKIINSKVNNGTVKNVNNALKEITGDYFLLIAADDKLYDRNVVRKYIDEFENNNYEVVTAQCVFSDEYLDKEIYNFVNAKLALKLNKESSLVQYENMAKGCFYASGATAYKTDVIKKYDKFDERYKFVEDWSYWLFLLRNGVKIYYSDFKAFMHRDGGISHSEYTPETLPNHVRGYYHDIINIYVNEIFPYWDQFTTSGKYIILNTYRSTVRYYSRFAPELLEYDKLFDEKRLGDSKLHNYFRLRTIKNILVIPVFKNIGIQFKLNRAVPIAVIIWIIMCLLVLSNIEINSYALFGIYLLSYYLIYCAVFILDKILYYILKK